MLQEVRPGTWVTLWPDDMGDCLAPGGLSLSGAQAPRAPSDLAAAPSAERLITSEKAGPGGPVQTWRSAPQIPLPWIPEKHAAFGADA
jgi:hypothetical protein